MSVRKRPSLVLFFTLLVACCFFAAPVLQVARARQTANQPLVARITIQNQEAFLRLSALGLDLLEMRDGDSYFFLTNSEQLEQLQREGWEVKVDQAQTDRLINQQRVNTFSGGYRTVTEMRALLQNRATSFPNLAEYFVYGQSWEKMQSGGVSGNDLFGIKLTNKARPGPKPTFFLMAAIHSRELTTSELALRLVDYLLNNYETDGDVAWLLDEHLIVIVPSVNPDGHLFAEQGFYQRKNTDSSYGGNCANPPTVSNQFGVDLNRNHAFKWGTVNPPSEPRCGQTYPGPTAASEPETTAVQNLVLSLFPDQRGPNDTDPAPATTTGTMLTLHSYSDLVLWPWGWSANPAPNAPELSLIGRKYAAYNGYTPQQSIALYPTSGTTDDWAYGELGICSMTFEVGPESGTCGGFFPPFTCLDTGSGGNFWLRNLPAFLYAARIARAPYQLVQGPTPESAVTANATASSFDLRVQLDEQYNGGQPVAAAEYYVDTPPWRGGTAIAMTALDGSFNGLAETATATVSLQGRHLLYVRGRDASGNWGPVRGIFTPSVCGFSIAPANQSFAWASATGNVTVTAGAGCNWTATSNAAWIAVTSGANGTGNGTVVYSLTSNPTFTPRSGTLTIAGQTFTLTQAGRVTPLSFDGDAKSDITIWRPSTGLWQILNSSTGSITSVNWGTLNDQLVPADFDGDGKTDVAVFRPANGTWYIQKSSTGTVQVVGWGASGDTPVPADFDGDGKTDVAIFRPSNGTWYILNSASATVSVTGWGVSGDTPVAGDYDGDGKADVAVYRPSNGTWYILNSSTGSIRAQGWGISTDVPVPADFDGDGKTDVAVFRPANGTWYIQKSSTGTVQVVGWGASTDVPVPGDYDGDGKIDVAVYRPSNGTWYILNSSSGLQTNVQLGINGDVPV